MIYSAESCIVYIRDHSYNKLTGKSASDFEKAEYATRFWQFICKFGKKYKDVVKTKRTDGSIWVFDNAVATDGYSISFQITTIENFKRKDKFKKAIELDESVESVKRPSTCQKPVRRAASISRLSSTGRGGES